MYLLDLTLELPESNLALDAALLSWSEAAHTGEREFLRLWEPSYPMVVIGRSSRIAEEVDLLKCESRQIPVLRRASGGASIVTGPGCLMYCVILDLEKRPDLKLIDRAHATVLGVMSQALAPLVPTVGQAGTSDLAFSQAREPSEEQQPDRDWLKFSGNSVRVGKRAMMYHGTLLYDFDLSLVAELLLFAPRQPAYRAGRHHGDFVGNLTVGAAELKQALVNAWQADVPFEDLSQLPVDELIDQQYGLASWHRQR